MNMKGKILVLGALAASSLIAAPKQNFANDVEKFLGSHPVAGVGNFQELLGVMAEPNSAAAKIDATVQPCHKARKVRVWGLRMLDMLKSMGLDAAEVDPDAFNRGECIPDVLILTQPPNFSEGDVEMVFRMAAEGVHVVSLRPTDQWSKAIAKRLGFKYDGVLTIGSPAKGGALIPNCPKLMEGFPAKKRLNAEFGAMSKWLHGMYLTGDAALMCVADAGQGRIASSVAQYRVGRGAITLVGPNLLDTPDDPACRRFLLNLINLLPPAPKPLKLPCLYHPDAPEGKPYFELRVPGSRTEYVTEARPRDHLWHPALFFGWRIINGRNFWEPRNDGAKNKVVSHVETPTPDGALLACELAYELNGKAILSESRKVKVSVKPDGGYSLDWTGDFTALDDLEFTASKPVWNKEKGTSNGCGYCGLSMRLAKNSDFDFAFTNALGSADMRCFGDVSPRIDVYAKSKRTGATTRVSFIADRPTANYTLCQPERNAPDGFHFVAFPEAFNKPLKMSKGEKRTFHYVVDVQNL